MDPSGSKKPLSFTLQGGKRSTPKTESKADLFLDSFPSSKPTIVKQDHLTPANYRPESNNRKLTIPWLQVGLVVRILESNLFGGLYYGRTAIVKRVIHDYGGELQVDNGDLIILDQDDCTTIVPTRDECGLLLDGEYAGVKARITLSASKGDEVEVELEEGSRAGLRLLIPSSCISKHIAINN